MTARGGPAGALALGLLAALALAAPAAAAPVDVPAALGPRLAKVADRTPIAVLVPDELDLDVTGRVYASSAPGRRRWAFSLAAAPGCGGATACYLATISAQRGGEPAFRTRVRLRGGIPGWYKPLSCGASCSPAVLQFRRRGVLYELAAKLAEPSAAGQRAALVAAANSALRAGPR